MALMIPAFNNDQINHIAGLAAQSDIYDYNWRDRGRAPVGYIEGMALTWAQCYLKYKQGDTAMVLCAAANSHHSDIDVLSWYRGFFDDAGMPNEAAGSETLRHLFVLLLGLGMRESSGKYCTGRDMSASNTSSDTAEAGAFQTSWNIRSCSAEIPPLLDLWEPGNHPQCYVTIFAKGVTCSSSDWSSYGSGDGELYQDMSKHCPPFHAEVTMVGLRKLRQHWGPINRYEVEVRSEADEMFREVQLYVDTWGQPVPPEPIAPVPTITVTIDPPGSAKVIVTGSR